MFKKFLKVITLIKKILNEHPNSAQCFCSCGNQGKEKVGPGRHSAGLKKWASHGKAEVVLTKSFQFTSLAMHPIFYTETSFNIKSLEYI